MHHGWRRQGAFEKSVPHRVGHNNSRGVGTELKSIGMILVSEVMADAPAVEVCAWTNALASRQKLEYCIQDIGSLVLI